MSAWIVITPAHLVSYQIGAIMDALRTAALAEGQPDPFDEIMQARCDYIRNRISKKIQVSLTRYAVPPELKTCACWLIIEAMQGRVPGIELSKIQETQISDAKRDLDIAGTEEFPISIPDDPATPAVQSGGGAISVVRKSTPNLSRQSMNGL